MKIVYIINYCFPGRCYKLKLQFACLRTVDRNWYEARFSGGFSELNQGIVRPTNFQN